MRGEPGPLCHRYGVLLRQLQDLTTLDRLEREENERLEKARLAKLADMQEQLKQEQERIKAAGGVVYKGKPPYASPERPRF